MIEYDVFLSCKSEDYGRAGQICDFLTSHGLKVFFAPREITKRGQSAYRAAIMQALEKSYHLVIFASQPQYIDSRWVAYEWESFLSLQLSGLNDGQIITILDGITPRDINHEFLKYQSFPYNDYKDDILSFLESPRDKDKISGESVLSPLPLPRVLRFPIAEKNIMFVLSVDQKYYIGNIKSSDSDFSWLKNAGTLIGVIPAAICCVGGFFAPVLSLLALLIGTYFSTDSNATVDNKLCSVLSQKTGYRFSVPTEEELFCIEEDAKKYCIVLRVKDNLEALLTTAKTSSSM